MSLATSFASRSYKCIDDSLRQTIEKSEKPKKLPAKSI